MPAGRVFDLGTLPGDSSSEAVAINAAGDVVGYSKGPRGLRAFLRIKAGGTGRARHSSARQLRPSSLISIIQAL